MEKNYTYKFLKYFPAGSDDLISLYAHVDVKIPAKYVPKKFEDLISSTDYEAIRFLSDVYNHKEVNSEAYRQEWETRERQYKDAYRIARKFFGEERSLKNFMWDMEIADGELRRAEAIYDAIAK